jgi:hypothetical protein
MFNHIGKIGRNVHIDERKKIITCWKNGVMVNGLDFYYEDEGFKSSQLYPIWMCLTILIV